MDTAQWPQEIVVKPMEEIIVQNPCSPSATTPPSNIISNNNNNNNSNSNNSNNNKVPSTSLERKIRPQKDQNLNCPRCNSTNTKFCYYNNYSLTQPRYFCKTCRRYWTEGGSLRSIPVGGGSRKNKRSSSSATSSPSPASKKLSHDLIGTNPSKIHHHHQGQDLNLGFPQTHQEFRTLSDFIQLPAFETAAQKAQMHNSNVAASNGNNTTAGTANHHSLSALELLNGLASSRGLTAYMPMPGAVPDPNVVYSSSGFPMQDYKPTLNFTLDGLGNGYGGLQGGVQQEEGGNNGRLLFPFEDLKASVSNNNTSAADHQHHHHQHHNGHDNNGSNDEQSREQGDSAAGYWSGMLGNGGSW